MQCRYYFRPDTFFRSSRFIRRLLVLLEEAQQHLCVVSRKIRAHLQMLDYHLERCWIAATAVFPGLGVGAMVVDDSYLRHLMNVSSLSSCVVRGEGGNTTGAVSPLYGYAKPLSEFYNRTSRGIGMAFHELFATRIPPVSNSLNSLDDLDACVSGDPIALVLAYRPPSSLFHPSTTITQTWTHSLEAGIPWRTDYWMQVLVDRLESVLWTCP